MDGAMSLQRRMPLKRGKPLKATRWGIKRKPARRIAKRVALRPYLALVAKMPCAAELHGSMCSGRVQVAHLGKKPGVGLKCPDDEVGPLCRRHHEDHDQYRGVFKGWTREERRVWADGVIASCRLAVVPTNEDEAIDLENLGLGRRVVEEGGRWSWETVVRVEGINPQRVDGTPRAAAGEAPPAGEPGATP